MQEKVVRLWLLRNHLRNRKTTYLVICRGPKAICLPWLTTVWMWIHLLCLVFMWCPQRPKDFPSPTSPSSSSQNNISLPILLVRGLLVLECKLIALFKPFMTGLISCIEKFCVTDMLFNPSSVAKTVVKGFKGNKVFCNTFTTVTHTRCYTSPHTHSSCCIQVWQQEKLECRCSWKWVTNTYYSFASYWIHVSTCECVSI